MNLQLLDLFLTVSECSNFSEASRRLGIDKSKVSRKIKTLESEIGNELFVRTPKSITLTSAGKRLLERAPGLISHYEALRDEVSMESQKCAGSFKISTTHPIASTWIPGILSEFSSLYPELRLEVIASSEPLDLAIKEADVALRPRYELVDLEYTLVRSWKLQLFASREYVKEFGLPETEEELDNHRLIVFGDSPTLYSKPHARWSLKNKQGVKDREYFMLINNLQGMYQLVKDGVGIGTLSDENLKKDKCDLVTILPQKSQVVDLYLIHHRNMESDIRVQSFKKFVISKVKEGY